MYADDATVSGLITLCDEAAGRREEADVDAWCQNNNLFQNANRSKKIVDPRKSREQNMLLPISEIEVERVNTFKFTGVRISEDLTWFHGTK